MYAYILKQKKYRYRNLYVYAYKCAILLSTINNYRSIYVYGDVSVSITPPFGKRIWLWRKTKYTHKDTHHHPNKQLDVNYAEFPPGMPRFWTLFPCPRTIIATQFCHVTFHQRIERSFPVSPAYNPCFSFKTDKATAASLVFPSFIRFSEISSSQISLKASLQSPYPFLVEYRGSASSWHLSDVSFPLWSGPFVAFTGSCQTGVWWHQSYQKCSKCHGVWIVY